jgi:sulfoxide reductase heme-binding subunit YedZ
MATAESVVRGTLRPTRWILALAPLVWLVVRAFQGDLGANPIERIEDESGQWTLRFLALSLAITPLIRLTQWGWLIRERRFFGLAAFGYASTHLLVYLGLDQGFDLHDIGEDILKHLWITVGMAAFLLLLPLAITSTKGWIRRLGGARWRALHRLAYVAAFMGCIHFLWSVKKDLTEPIIYSSVFAILMAMRAIRQPRTTR